MVDLLVSDEEWLARYILRKDHVRQDGTVKPDPFIPHPHADLSVTRHLGLDEQELWNAGTKVAEQVANKRPGATTLQGLLSDPLDKLISFTVVYLVLSALPARFKQRFPFVRQYNVFGKAPAAKA